ncbi:trimeric intracellular cation channel family protein [Carboxylicivirga sediminis]|uniref:Trimeric intracellular cation channel family protein n=1 Tax=Carboxylicivirga sediminis TaxID=2006564 RepID=A0A941F2A6_9BACT|nr:trimeric intracellular cation channel family protein [Carboxylicivirga sediminis]MBR8535461.1 trimeric intracellular cation channel family protein [Carboxylicivirga sediminis]
MVQSFDLLLLFDYIGTMVFAISGTLTAAQKRLDIFGAIFIGFVTAIGGGTVRDIMLGNLPVSWIQSNNYFFVILAGILITILFKKHVIRLRNTLFLFDTIGIGVFTVLGLEKAMAFGISAPIAVIMGLSSAVVGGIIRDTLTNEVPLIFHKEIYATACITGAIIFLILHYLHVPEVICESVTVLSIIGIRLWAVKYNITMPHISLSEKE